MSLERVLFVDDEPQILAAFRRMLRGRYEIETSSRPQDVLELMRERGPFAVLVSDMQMPVLDGARLLAEARVAAPDTTRIMLTGNADQTTAARAVNEGAIFRFVNKPCSAEQFVPVLDAAIEHHRHLRAERELLEHTLQGAVGVLTEILSLTDPDAFGKATRLRDQAGIVARGAGCERVWEIELAALMSQLGLISVPQEVRHKQALGEPLTEDEVLMLARVPSVGAGLLARIPRLDGVAAILAALAPADAQTECDGASVLRPLLAIARREGDGRRRDEAWATVRASAAPQARIASAIDAWVAADPVGDAQSAQAVRRLLFSELHPGMVTDEPIRTADGRVLLGEHQIVTVIGLERIRNHVRLSGVREPIAMHIRSRAEVDSAEEAA
jgi:response regulator RpfG family c-di-GMP phosphodiesterase